jgi:hypothetical protein
MTVEQGMAYLQIRDIKTFNRLVKIDGLPIHRLGSGPKAQRRCYRSELDDWLLRSRCSDNAPAREVAS